MFCAADSLSDSIQYVRLVYSGGLNCPAGQGYLTVADVAIWSGGVNQATGKTTTASAPISASYLASYAIDANNGTLYYSANPRCRV